MSVGTASSAVLAVLQRLATTTGSLRNLATRYHSASNANILRGDGISQLSASYDANHAAMQQLLSHLERLTAVACRGGGEQAVKRHKERGKLPPRDRINAILDTGTPFLELSHLAGHGLYGARPRGIC